MLPDHERMRLPSAQVLQQIGLPARHSPSSGQSASLGSTEGQPRLGAGAPPSQRISGRPSRQGAGAPPVRRLPSIEVELGRLLRSCRDGQHYLTLGFVRFGDYVVERLGISLRTAQEQIRVTEALSGLPRTAASFAAGEIMASHVRLLSRVATPEGEAFWLARARRLDVRALARAIAVAVERGDGGSGEACSPGLGSQPDAVGEADGDQDLVRLTLRGPVWLLRWWRETVTFVGRLVGNALPPGAALEVVLAESAEITVGASGSPPGSLEALGRFRGRRAASVQPGTGGESTAVSGSEEPRSACPIQAGRAGSVILRRSPGTAERDEDVRLERSPNAVKRNEDVKLERLPGGTPFERSPSRAESGGETASKGAQDNAGSDTGAFLEGSPISMEGGGETTLEGARDNAGSDGGTFQASSPIRTEGGGKTTLEGSGEDPLSLECSPSSDLSPAQDAETTPTDPAGDAARAARALDIRLRELVGARQRAEALLADRLVCLRASRRYLLEGHFSLRDYARERMGLSPRRVYYLLSLHRTLERLSDLRRAFMTGRLTLKQSLLVGRVATRKTVAAWLRRAEKITLRRLEDEVAYWELLRHERPEVWELLRGEPLPDGIVLVPGQPPRLHASAQAEDLVSPESTITEVNRSRLYASTQNPRGENHDPSGARDKAGDVHGSACAGEGHTASIGPEQRPRHQLHAFAPDTPGGDRDHSDAQDEADDMHRSAPGGAIDPRSFLCALQESEALTPLPDRRCTIRMRVEAEVRRQWQETASSLHSMSDEPLEEWEIFALVLSRFWKTWDNDETRSQRRAHAILERDGWRCTVPCCRSVGTGRLHQHHIVFRSAGGAVTDPSNVTSLCTTHHQHLLHAGLVRCRGAAPDDLTWKLGVGKRLPAFLAYHGDLRVGGCAT